MKKTSTVSVNLGTRSYDILIGTKLLPDAGRILADVVGSRRCLLVTDSNVRPLYGETVREALAIGGDEVCEYVFEAGEERKTPETINSICRMAVRSGLDRKSLFIALGGGVCGDMAGFAAAVYMRGVDFVQIPTSLLAMVDSSVGGKTGVDLPEGKNLMGAFWQPRMVLIDLNVLATLPRQEIRCGLAEIIKYGVIMDKELFALLEEAGSALLSPDPEQYAKIIKRCCELKAKVVENDELENGRRAILNYGHTFGHALEVVSNFRLSHGEGVAVGMNMAAELGVVTGLISREVVIRQQQLLKACELPIKAPPGIKPDEIFAAMLKDKKKIGVNLRLVLPEELGSVVVTEHIEKQEIIAAIRSSCD